MICDKYSEYSFTLISFGGESTVTSNVILSNSSSVTGGNLGSLVAAEIEASTNPSHNFLSGTGYPIHPLRSSCLVNVTNTPEVKLNFELKSELKFFSFVLMNFVTVFLAILTSSIPSESEI